MANHFSKMVDQGKLPLGFRFNLTDEDLITHYVKKMNEGSQLPFHIPEISPYKCHPKTLPAYFKYGKINENYYFTELDPKNERDVRVTRSIKGVGYWKTTSKDIPIIDSTTKKTIGFVKKFTFYETSPTETINTGWIMHEFRCAPSLMKGKSLTKFRKITGYVLCKIYLNSTSASGNSVESIDTGKECVPMATDEEVEPGSADSERECESLFSDQLTFDNNTAASSNSMEAIDTGKECDPKAPEEVEAGPIPHSTPQHSPLHQQTTSCPTGKGIIINPDDPHDPNQLCSADHQEWQSLCSELFDNDTAVKSSAEQIQFPKLPNMDSLLNEILFYEDSRSIDMEVYTSPISSTY